LLDREVTGEAYTANMDFACLLADAFLPGVTWVLRGDARGFVASVTTFSPLPSIASAEGATASMALLAAVLNAMAGKATAAEPL
jgi:hypothetical protein